MKTISKIEASQKIISMTLTRIVFFLAIAIVVACNKKEKEAGIVDKSPLTKADDEDVNAIEEFDKLIKEYEDKDRDNWQQPEVILAFLGNLKGKKVADIGAGTGYFSFKIGRIADTVYAIDIDQRFLDYIEERKEGLRYGLGQNVITKLGLPEDPKLPGDVDIVFLVNTYSYIENRTIYFQKVKKFIKPKGFLCIVDFKVKNVPVGPPTNLRISPTQAMDELRKSGFSNFKVDSVSLPYQYILKAS